MRKLKLKLIRVAIICTKYFHKGLCKVARGVFKVYAALYRKLEKIIGEGDV